MQIFYCILLVIVIFFTVMEIIAGTYNTNVLVHTDDHKYHLYTYVIIFLVIASLLAAERYM